MKTEIDKGTGNTQATFEADNAFHDAVSRMGHNPLIDKINRVVQMLTWSIRLETVTHMVETGRGEELYKAHEKICQMLKDRDMSNLSLIFLSFDLEKGLPAKYLLRPETFFLFFSYAFIIPSYSIYRLTQYII